MCFVIIYLAIEKECNMIYTGLSINRRNNPIMDFTNLKLFPPRFGLQINIHTMSVITKNRIMASCHLFYVVKTK